MCIGEYPSKITVIILDNNNVVQVFNIASQVNDQLIISGGRNSINIPNDTFRVNVTMSNNGGNFNHVPSFSFGKPRKYTYFY